ncbi:MAG: thioredoxin-disulfide reductase [Bacteroidia bacterium]
MEKVECLIIGSGPAGYTAAIYAARADMKPVVYEGLQPGGQLTITTDVENYPGYPDGIMGPEMMENFKKQAVRLGADVRFGMITAVEFDREGGNHKVTVDGQTQIECETVIISTGASAKWLGIESETRLNGSGVSACAVCDGFFYRNMDVAIVGAGDTAAEEASYLSKICKKVYMLVRKDEMRASKAMQHRVNSLENVEVLFNTETDEIMGDTVVEGVRVVNNITGEKKVIDLQGFFVAIGHKPNTDIFKDYLKMDDAGYLITHADSAKTDIPGVFACGDAQDKIYRQAVTAAGSGCMAALDAERYLSARGMEV